VLLVVAAHLFEPTAWEPLSVAILHTLHGPGFAILAVSILWYLQRQSRAVVNYFLAALIAMSIGVVSEAAQIPGSRDAQFQDLLVDALGIFGAVGVSASIDTYVRGLLPVWARLLLPTVAGAALAIACIPTLWIGHAIIQQQRAFPVLLTFENRWETAAFGQTASARPSIAPAPLGWPGDGTSVARATEDGRWGIFLSVKPLRDWRGYSQISFVAASTSEPFVMDIGIREMYHDKSLKPNRYYQTMHVGPEPKMFTITFEHIQAAMKDRPFDFSHVESIVFSAAKPGSRREILMDDIRLH